MTKYRSFPSLKLTPDYESPPLESRKKWRNCVFHCFVHKQKRWIYYIYRYYTLLQIWERKLQRLVTYVSNILVN